MRRNEKIIHYTLVEGNLLLHLLEMIDSGAMMKLERQRVYYIDDEKLRIALGNSKLPVLERCPLISSNNDIYWCNYQISRKQLQERCPHFSNFVCNNLRYCIK